MKHNFLLFEICNLETITLFLLQNAENYKIVLHLRIFEKYFIPVWAKRNFFRRIIEKLWIFGSSK